MQDKHECTSCARLADEVARLRAERGGLRDFVQRIAEINPTARHDGYAPVCVFCWCVDGEHSEECPWCEARAILARLTDTAASTNGIGESPPPFDSLVFHTQRLLAAQVLLYDIRREVEAYQWPECRDNDAPTKPLLERIDAIMDDLDPHEMVSVERGAASSGTDGHPEVFRRKAEAFETHPDMIGCKLGGES